MATNALPAQSELLKLLRYEPSTGRLYWLAREASWFGDGKQTASWNAAIWNGKNAGKEAFTTVLPTGYRYGSIRKRKLLAHRVIWKISYGEEPAVIDHISGDTSDNRLENLRSVTQLDNSRNSRRGVNNKSGVNGVSWCAPLKKWAAKIHVGGASIHIGVFDELADAAAARKAADEKYGFHENHGRD